PSGGVLVLGERLEVTARRGGPGLGVGEGGLQRFDLSREGGRGGGGALVALVDDPRLAVESVELTLRGRRPVGGGGHLGVGAVEDGGSLLVAASHAGDLGLDPGDA